ncbi:diguanylate cyclase domain-containing protein [Enterovibrio norvegicus]|uniref:diguanylate cyclase domain-containing protein n=1 Tax=Enterovibrio norvegicus TaxID=188144 RepID=UPI0024B063D5|nr:diguanylate cyclase [Enterovibrio norvegicus]
MALLKRRYIRMFVVIIGIVFSASLSALFSASEHENIVSDFEFEVERKAAAFSQTLDMNFEALQSISTLFRTYPDTGYLMFKQEAQRVLQRHSGIQGLEWAPRIFQEERTDAERVMQLHFPEFSFTHISPHGNMAIAKESQEYYPIYYVEPYFGNEKVLGFDLGSNPRRMSTLIEARDSGQAKATASIRLIQETENQRGFLTMVPIYQGAVSTLAHRQKNIIGIVLAVNRIGDIFVMSQHGELPTDLSIRLFDITNPKQVELLFDRTPKDAILSDDLRYTTSLPTVLGRQWKMEVTATKAYLAGKKSMTPIIVFASGIMLTAFFTAYLSLMFRHSGLVEKEVIERTKDLDFANNELRKLSQNDALTGLYNRRYFDEYASREWLRAQRTQTPLSLLLIDVDHFKRYNDCYGHHAGDVCLKQIASALQHALMRSQDIVCRYGGEEFVIVLPDTTEPGNVAERCRAKIAALGIEHNGNEDKGKVSISIGAATAVPSGANQFQDLFNAADEALYEAKSSGRDCTVIRTGDVESDPWPDEDLRA